ncbi:MAG: hypothetical protein ACK44Z_07045, partial [Pirellulaceae bacterium]
CCSCSSDRLFGADSGGRSTPGGVLDGVAAGDWVVPVDFSGEGAVGVGALGGEGSQPVASKHANAMMA